MEQRITPIIFYEDKVIQSEDIGTNNELPIKNFLDKTNNANLLINGDFIINNYIINNISDLCNTFMIRLLENYINKDEIAYIIDFTDKFDIKEYLKYSLLNAGIVSNSINNNQMMVSVLINLLFSDIIFIMNQFIQFYVMTKLVYKKEGIDLYKYLYKDTYEETAPEARYQDQYVFCVSIMGSMLDLEIPNIHACLNKLYDTLSYINYRVIDKAHYYNN